MQRIFNIDKWSKLAEGSAYSFANDKPRNVRLEVNAPVKTALHYIDGEGEVFFLALVEGRDTIEFGTTGSYSITVEGADCMIYTADGDDISQTVLGAQSFIKIAERRRRNPELEFIAAQMQANMNKRLEAQAGELATLFANRLAAATAKFAPAGVPAAAGSEPAPPNGAGSPDPQALSTGGGSSSNGPTEPTGAGGTG